MKKEAKHLGKVKMGKDVVALHLIAYVFCGVMAIVCLVPFLMVVSGSVSSEASIADFGFSIWPHEFSWEAYGTVFKEPMVIVRAYGVTIGLTVAGTMIGLVVSVMTAYVLCRKDFEWRNAFSFFFYFTTLFNGGLVPTYILYMNTLNLGNTYLAMLLPLLFSVYNLLIMKSYITSIPDSLVDAAKMDGCSEIKIMFLVIMPLIKPALATVGLLIALAYWNSWYHAMLFITEDEMFPLQYFLSDTVNNIEAYKRLIASGASISSDVSSALAMPSQTLKMALTVVVTGPIIFAYPFVQKYFVQGITIGAVKG